MTGETLKVFRNSKNSTGQEQEVHVSTMVYVYLHHQKMGRASIRVLWPTCKVSLPGCPTFWHLWAWLEEEELP